jgi:hypothetical protein
MPETLGGLIHRERVKMLQISVWFQWLKNVTTEIIYQNCECDKSCTTVNAVDNNYDGEVHTVGRLYRIARGCS